MKYEWKKQDKALYGTKQTPRLITVPEQKYIMISGSGNPNASDFSYKVGALYSLAYAIKMDYKSLVAEDCEINDFTVYPLEGVWSLKQSGEWIKDDLEYAIMIRQPDFITDSIVLAALEKVKIKKPNLLYEKICFGTMQDGLCVEMLHVGPYDDEPTTFAAMEQFAKDNGLARTENRHREIYLNNAGRVAASRLKTILRYKVK